MLDMFLSDCPTLGLQLIFKRYDKDKTWSISSFEMRNAVNDAGEQKKQIFHLYHNNYYFFLELTYFANALLARAFQFNVRMM